MTDTRETAGRQPDAAIDTVDAVIVGAGFAGMYMLHKLRRLGFSAVVFDAAADVGGTWYWNRYPGARCDVESINYSYSFDPELEQEWEWSERYATQPEILRYANHVADRYDLRRDIQFSTRVTAADFDESAPALERHHRRRATTSRRSTSSWRSAASRRRRCPRSPASSAFRGSWYHTGHWPHEGVDFTGQRVGVIGTGSSAIQSIPIIAEQAAHLTVFQRTPNFSLPAKNAPLDPDEIQALKARYPEHRQEARTSAFGVPNPLPEKSALEVDEAEREATYEEGFEKGSLVGMLLSYNDLITDKAANDTAAEYVRKRIRQIVDDPEVAEALAPTDHPIGTKRPCLDTDYYATYNRPNVELVDLRKTPLVEVTENGVRTSEREYEFDSIVFATGFDAMTGSLVAFDIKGSRRCDVEGEVGRRAAHLPRRRHRRVPQHVHDHRPWQPVSADQHDDLHRAARRLDRRCDDVHARARQAGHRPDPRVRGRVDGARQRGRQHDALPIGELVVHGLQRGRQAACVPAVHRRCRPLPRRSATRSPRRATTAST